MNVLGFMNKSSQLESVVFEGSIKTEVVVGCFDEFSQRIEKRHTAVSSVWIDNASTHTSVP